ncbi:hypothetical protein LTR08_005097 [Meristemomyces frigidus]|nr:hypothetical protein LTR08_005097 [Meristemomyces frigidus]
MHVARLLLQLPALRSLDLAVRMPGGFVQAADNDSQVLDTKHFFNTDFIPHSVRVQSADRVVQVRKALALDGKLYLAADSKKAESLKDLKTAEMVENDKDHLIALQAMPGRAKMEGHHDVELEAFYGGVLSYERIVDTLDKKVQKWHERF